MALRLMESNVSAVSDKKKITLPVFSGAGDQVGELEVSGALFGVEVKPQVLDAAVLAYLANQRQGTADTKERGEVAGSARKLYRQKGTGRARAGSRRSPTRVGGGVIFGPTPRDYRQRLPKKVRRQALNQALSSLAGAGEIKVLDALALEGISTKSVAEMIRALGLENEKVLLITGKADEILSKSARNIEKLAMVRAEDLNAYVALRFRHLLFTREGLDRLQEVSA
jgi:large subunit ribosomal protein L4